VFSWESEDPLLFPYLAQGKRVRVVSGALAGLYGLVVRAPDGSRRVVVSVPLLGRSVAVSLGREKLESAVI